MALCSENCSSCIGRSHISYLTSLLDLRAFAAPELLVVTAIRFTSLFKNVGFALRYEYQWGSATHRQLKAPRPGPGPLSDLSAPDST